MIQRVGIAQAIIDDPDVVILDEPMSGLDPDGRYDLSQLILEIHKTGKTIFFSSHLLDDVQKLCDDLIILKNGATIFQGAKAEFMNAFTSNFVVTYSDNGKTQNVTVETLDLLNAKIDVLRKDSCQIIEVQTKTTLEQAYILFQKEKS